MSIITTTRRGDRRNENLWRFLLQQRNGESG